MTTTFKVGDDLYCYSEKDRIPYEAKITAIKEHKGARKYFVHYKGWNVRYDEKVPVDQIEGKLFKTLADYKPPATNGASSEPSTSTAAPAAAPKARPAASSAAKPAAAAAAKPKSPAKPAPKPAPKAKTASAESAPSTSTKPTRKAAAPASQPQTSAASSSSQDAPGPYAFALHEECVCLRGGVACEAKVMAIKDHHGHMRYTISYKGLSAKHNDHVRVGSEKDRMFKGSMKEYKEKHPEAATAASSSDGASTSAGPSTQEPTTTRQKRGAAAAAAEPATSEAEEEKTVTKKSKKN
ncbi:unnamed protein product [Caenorhabditis brenneri]